MPSGKAKVKEKENPDGANARATGKAAAKAPSRRPRASQASRLATTAKAIASFAMNQAVGAMNAFGREK